MPYERGTGILLAFFVAVMVSSGLPAALAEDVELSVPPAGDQRAYTFMAGAGGFKSAQKPEDAVAPAGGLSWGRLTLGLRSYLVCVARQEKSRAKLYLDTDGDNNLAEETPIRASEAIPGDEMFFLDGIAASFRVKGGPVTVKLDLLLEFAQMPGKATRRVSLGTATTFLGAMKEGPPGLSIAWTPGQAPRFRPRTNYLGTWAGPKIYHGNQSLSVESPVSLKAGKVVAVISTAPCQGLVECAAPKGIAGVGIPSSDGIRVHLPDKGKFFLPAGTHSLVVLAMAREGKGGPFDLTVQSRELKVQEGFTLGEIEPLRVSIEIVQKAKEVTFQPKLTDCQDRRANLDKGEGPLTLRMIVKDAEGKGVADHAFERG
ncbi:MAG: hypothetical protein ACYTHM_12260 [Planctomycetota bacterium]|jgi:hypothetical protein